MSGVEGLRARVASADAWLQDSARVHAAAGKLGFAQHNENARALLADLLERIAALEADAARYRWLRERHDRTHQDWHVRDPFNNAPDIGALDAALDAARVGG